MEHGFLFSALVYLLAAVIAVPVAGRLGLGSVLGYLLAGVVIGPWVLGLIHDPEEILHFAEFGVVLLLFLIGLELNPRRLWEMRRPILGLGGGQVLLTAALLAGAGLLLGADSNTAVIAGMALALSSTAIVLQIFSERKLLPTSAGQSGFSILLFQDIAVIPMLAVIPLLGPSDTSTEEGSFWLGALQVFGVIALIIVGGRFAIRPVFRFIAATELREIFIAFSLLLVIGVAMLMQLVEMSMALGAFIAGVLLAESEYRHELEIDIEPFKGLLMGLFFIAVGMSVDFGLLLSVPLTILGLVLGLVVIKIAVLWLLAKLFQVHLSQRSFFALVLSQGGEFAFVLFSVAVSNQVLAADTAAVLVVVVALSMVTTPLLLIVNEKFIEPRLLPAAPPYDEMDEPDSAVIIAGYGRIGQMVGRLMQANSCAITVIERDPDQIELLRKFGWKVYYGDATRPDLLHAAGAQQAKLLVVAIDDQDQVLRLVDTVKHQFPNLPVVARARNRTHAYQLLDRGVELFERETFESSLRLAEKALVQLGMRGYAARQAINKFRVHDIANLYKLHKVHHDEAKLVSMTKQSRADLERLFLEERKNSSDADGRERADGWG